MSLNGQRVEGQHAAALKFGDPRAMALFQALRLFCWLPQGFRNATLRELIAPALNRLEEAIKQHIQRVKLTPAEI